MNAVPITSPAPAAAVTERVVDEWLVLEAPLAADGPSAAETLLAVNAVLRGGIKFVFTPERRPCLRAELPWDEERASDAARATAIADLEEVRARSPEMNEAGALAVRASGSPPGEALSQAAAECGWPVTSRRDGSLAAELEVPGGQGQARFTALDSGGSLAFAEVAAWEDAAPDSRRAIATLLLLAGRAVRGARPALRAAEGKPVAVFEARLPVAPSPADVVDALSSLSLAVRLCGAEAGFFFNKQIAREYLEVGASVSHTQTTNSNNQ